MMYSYWKERIKHAVRFRHKRGFGVHSPFMFHFILAVLRDKGHCFIYPEEAEKITGIPYRQRKLYRLLYRLVVFLKSKNVLCINAVSEPSMAYIQEGAEQVSCNNPVLIKEADLVYIGTNMPDFLMEQKGEWIKMVGNRKQCIVITDIHKKGVNAWLWRQWGVKATVRIDMMWYGILLFDEKLQKGKYNLII